RCGKSRLQTVLGWMSLRPLRASNISSAAVYRTVEACCPTLLLDEADTFVHGNEELRGILNSGHTRDQAPILQVAELIGPPWKDAAYAAMRALNPGGNGDPESESRNEDSTTALLIRLRQAFYNLIQDPAREAAETRASARGQSEVQIEAAG